LELYANNPTTFLHKFILQLFSTYIVEVGFLHDFTQDFGKIGETLFIIMDVIENFPRLPHIDMNGTRRKSTLCSFSIVGS
jgi:hypothetical protein